MTRWLSLASCLMACSSQPSPSQPSPSQPSQPSPSPSPPSTDQPPPEPQPLDQPDDVMAQPTIPPDMVALLGQADLVGTLELQVLLVPPLVVDICKGEARATHQDGALVGFATCTFGQDLKRLGSTSGRITIPPGQTTGTFDASPAPIVAPIELTQDGTQISLQMAGFVELGQNQTAAFRGTVLLDPKP